MMRKQVWTGLYGTIGVAVWLAGGVPAGAQEVPVSADDPPANAARLTFLVPQGGGVGSSDRVRAGQAYQAGFEELRAGRYREAVAQLNLAIQFNPMLIDAYRARGSAYEFLASQSKASPEIAATWKANALADYAQVLQFVPEDLWTLQSHARVLINRGEARAALPELSRVLERAPGNHQARQMRAEAAARIGRSDLAIEDLDRLIEVEPDNPDLRSLRAEAYYHQNSLVQALSDIDRVIAVRPDAQAYNDRATIHLKRKDYDLASKDLDEALRLLPTDPIARVHKAEIALARGHHAEALAELSEVVERNPTWAYGWRSRAQAFEQSGKLDEAVADLDRAIALEPRTAAFRTERGNFLRRIGRTDEAIAAYDEAIRLNPDDPSPWFGRANCHVRRGEPDAAIRDFQAFVARKPEDPRGYLALAEAQSSKGQPAAAVATLSEGITRHPASLELYSARAIHLGLELDEPAKARADLDRAIELGPEIGLFYLYRAWTSIQLGRGEEVFGDLSTGLATMFRDGPPRLKLTIDHDRRRIWFGMNEHHPARSSKTLDGDLQKAIHDPERVFAR